MLNLAVRFDTTSIEHSTLTHMKTSQLPENVALIEQAKQVMNHIPDTQFMATYDNFITFKQEGEVYALALWDIPSFVEAWSISLML